MDQHHHQHHNNSQDQEQQIYYGRSVNKVYNQEFIIDRRFKIVKELGHGAYGIVCSAKYDDGTSTKDEPDSQNNGSSDGSYVAIKKITNIFTKKILCKRALRELKLLQFFRGHKNITCLYDLDIIPNPMTGEFNEIYLYEELMECDMHQIIRSGQPLTDSHYQSFIYQVLCGLKYIHSADVLHRDLKPGNLLVNADCELKICDFGLARGFSENPDENAGFMTEYVATRWYRAPEIMLSFTNYTKAIDIWSVGCILAELLGGKPIFRGKDYVDQLNQILMILGTPPESTLQRIGSHRAQNYVRSLPIMRKVSYKQLFPDANPLALDLLEKMLTLDPHERISVEEALSHKYLEVWHDPRDEPECQVKFDFKSFETVDGLEDMRSLIIDEVKNFREFVRKPIEEQQQIQLQLQIQQREKQQAEEQQQQLQRAQAQEQNDYMDISQTPYTNLETNMVTPQVEEDYPRPQELNDFTFSNLESANASDSMHLYHDLAKPSGSEYIKLEEELGFGLDGAMFNNY
ncbi:Mitogen-activated protein kinase MKC1 [Candida tropicalis]